jgi:hypothetical protein
LPLDLDKAPWDNDQPNQETFDWLAKYVQLKTEPISTSLSATTPFDNNHSPTNATTTTTTDNEQYSKDHENLKLAIDSIVLKEYMKHILVNAPFIGTGFFGTVYRGYDTKLVKEFPIEIINHDILGMNGILKEERLKEIITSFQKEQQVHSITYINCFVL